MRDLLARLAQNDEEASAALRVLDYFDALDSSSAGPEAYLRGAAGLTSCGAGMILQGRSLALRIGGAGDRLPTDRGFAPSNEWVQRTLTSSTPDVVWLESVEHTTFHDLVLERVAQGVQRWVGRMEAMVPEPAQAWAALLNDPVPEERRQQLFAALRLDLSQTYQVVAHVPAEPSDSLHAYTMVQGVQVVATIRPAPVRMELEVGGRQRFGVGPAVEVSRLLDSWERAVVVLRLARQGEALPWDQLVVLGPLFLKADTADILAEPIVAAIEAGNLPWLDQTVTAVTQTGSVRGAADLLGLHHSTVQKRIDRLQQQFHLNMSNARHVYHLWMACAAHRYATFGTVANMEADVRLTPRPFDRQAQ
jgi:hypothetical protein